MNVKELSGLYHHTIEMKIRTFSIRQQPYHVERRSLQVLREHMEKQPEGGVVKPAQSERVGVIVLIPKKNDTLQFCVSY